MRRSDPHTRFRPWILAAIAAINVLSVAIVSMGLLALYQRDIRQAETQSQNLARALEQSIDHEFARIDLSLKTVVSELKLHSQGAGPSNEHTIQNVVRVQRSLLAESEGWSITDAQGQIIYHEGDTGTGNTSVADRDYFIALKSGKAQGLLVSKPINSRMTGNPVLILTRAYTDQTDKFGGLVVVPLPLSYLETLLSGFDVGKHGVLAVRGHDLNLIARARKQAPIDQQIQTANTLASQPLREMVAQGATEGTYSAINGIDPIERIYSFRRIQNAPIYVLAGISRNDALAGWHRLCWVSLPLLGLFLLVTNVSVGVLLRQWNLQRQYSTALGDSNARLQTSLQNLQERDQALISAQEAGGLGTYQLDIGSGHWSCSENLNTLFGIDASYPHTLEGWTQLIHPEDREWMSAYFHNEVLTQGRVFDREYRIVRPADNHTAWVHGLGKLDFDANSIAIRMQGTIQDISSRKSAEERLYLVREVFQSATEGILVTDRDGIIIETNPAFTLITGYSNEEAVGSTPRLLKSGIQDEQFYKTMWDALLRKGRWEGELINRRKDGSLYTQHSRIAAVRDPQGAILRFTALISDISELKQHQHQIEHLAYHDRLTGLPNRALLADRMEQAVARCKRRGEFLGVCYIDLDGFKPINDKWGHEIGDLLLIEVASRLHTCIRSGDTVARLGGDEFVVLFSDLKEQSDVSLAVGRMIDTLSEQYALAGFHLSLTVSAGVTTFPHDAAEDPDALIRHADQAMYEAKRSGKNRLHIFDPETDRRLHEQHVRYTRLTEALAHEEFRLYYQPKVDLRTGEVVGTEALIRWQHPEQGLLAPAQFLPIIETTDLTLSVGEWVLHEALRQKQRWQVLGIDLPVSVNVFALHLQRPDFADRLREILATYPEIAPTGLELEILETTAMDNLTEVTRCITACMEMGVRFALDDFGTGYSSLTYFRRLPVNVVKIDRSFVRNILTDANDQALVESIVGMARSLGRQVIAEGVETLDHGIPLLRFGCDLVQGYGVARPMSAEAFPDWLEAWRMPKLWKTPLLTDINGTL